MYLGPRYKFSLEENGGVGIFFRLSAVRESAQQAFRLQQADNHIVRIIYLRRIQRSEIDSRRAFRIMSHRFAYNGDGNILVFCDTGPRMAGHIARQRHG